MRTRRMIQLEIMKFYQREVNRVQRKQRMNKKRSLLARLVGLK